MTGVARQGYLLARLYGSVARSFVGANLRDLLRLKSLLELQARLWPAVEPAPAPSAADLEARIERSARDAMMEVLDFFERPPQILVHLLRRIECANVKLMLRSVAGGRREAMALADLGRYATVPETGATDPEAALRASPWAWAVEALAGATRAEVESRIDAWWYGELLRLAGELPSGDRTGVMRFVRFMAGVANAVGALRLRFVFGLDEAAAKRLLAPGVRGQDRQAVQRAFQIAPEAVEEWRGWRFGWLLEDQLADAFRRPDPVRAEAAAARRVSLRAHQLLHQYPMTLCPFVAWFVLREREAALLRSAVEGIELSIPENELTALVGAP